MKRAILWAVLAAGTVALVAGCSGAGAPSSDVGGASIQTLAANQLSAVALFTAWSKMLYVKDTYQATSNPPKPLPDGSLEFTGTNSDGSVYDYIVLDPSAMSSPGRGTLTWPDGTKLSETWAATVWTNGGNTSTDQITDTFPNGASLACTIVTNYGPQTHFVWDGTAKTAQGVTMKFHLNRADGNGQDQLMLTLPDGAVMKTTVPTTGQAADAFYWPVFGQGATGTYQAVGGPLMKLTLTGTDRWSQWKFTIPDGTAGVFTLDPNLLGQGQLTRAGATLGTLRWAANGVDTLELLGTGQQSVSPSAAANDFQINQWVENAAAIAPMPMY